MIRRSIIHKFPVFVFILLAVVLLAGCGGMGQKTRKPPGDFSRGLLLTDEASGTPSAAVNPEGNLIQVVIPSQDGDSGNSFRYIQIDQDARITMDQELALGLAPYVRSPKVVNNGEELHMVWAARKSTNKGWELWHAIINTDAEITSLPKLISQGTERVSQFEVTGDDRGNLTIVWEDSDSFSVHISRISGRGDIISPPELMITEGEVPALIADLESIHVTWMQGDKLFYSQVFDDSSFPLEGEELAKIQVAVGNRLDGPVIGITDSHVYLFWSILRQVGLEAGTAITEYLVFPKSEPAQAHRALVTIFPVSEDLLHPYQGSISLSQLVPAPPEDYLSTNYILDPRTLPNPAQGAQIVAVSANQNLRLDSHIQIAVGIFEEGNYQGYTVGTHTTEISQNPYISTDAGGNLHLIWREGFSGNRVYYATTSPTAKGSLDRVVLSDFSNFLLSGGLEAITGILLFPFAFPWMAIGLVMMIILRLAHNDEDVTQRLSQFLLVLALVSYQISKLLLLPDMLIYVPFSAWLDLPEGLGVVLRIAVPIMIAGLGITAAEWRRRRSSDSPPSSLAYYMTVIIVDTLLTLSVYGVIFLGEY